MQNRTLKSLIVLLGIIFIASCTDKYITKPYVAPPPPGYQYSLTTDVQPIFTGKCVTCHKAGGVPPDLTSGNSYASLTSMNLISTDNPENSIVYRKMHDGSMSGYCTQQDAEMVLNWIKQGAKNN